MSAQDFNFCWYFILMGQWVWAKVPFACLFLHTIKIFHPSVYCNWRKRKIEKFCALFRGWRGNGKKKRKNYSVQNKTTIFANSESDGNLQRCTIFCQINKEEQCHDCLHDKSVLSWRPANIWPLPHLYNDQYFHYIVAVGLHFKERKGKKRFLKDGSCLVKI